MLQNLYFGHMTNKNLNISRYVAPGAHVILNQRNKNFPTVYDMTPFEEIKYFSIYDHVTMRRHRKMAR